MKKALLILGILFGMISVNADENVLQSIEIIPVKDTYNIVLSADRAVDVKKSVQAPNKITLDMKGIRASKTLNTVYNNVSNVDTVMVEPSGNGISLFFQAENAQGASVSFDSLAPAIAKPETQKVKLNSPIESYTPIYREDLSSEKTSNLFDKITKKSVPVAADREESIDGNAVSDTANKAFSFVLVGALAFAVIRLFKRKEPEMKIGLSNGLNEREIEMYGNSQPIGAGYMNTEKPFTTVTYGLNAYKRENQNPYEQASMPIHNPNLRNYVSPMITRNVQTMSQDPMAQYQQYQNAQTMVQQAVRKNTTPINPEPVVSNPNIDNIKFLESMTAIYEKSGRHDLAPGLKTSLMKNNVK